jgi:hypothetical protein
VRTLRKGSGFRPDAPPACRGMAAQKLASGWHGYPKGCRRSGGHGPSAQAVGREGCRARSGACTAGASCFGTEQRTQGRPCSVGESPKSEKPMGASGRALVATPAGDNGLCNGQPPGVAETDRRIFGLRGKGQNDERGTGSGELGSDVWVTEFGRMWRGTLRRANVWKRVWRSRQRVIVVRDRLRTRRTPWSAAGCNKPVKR